LVCVFDAKEELAACLFGEKVVEESGTKGTKVEIAGW